METNASLLSIKMFDITKIRKHSKIAVIGKRGSGKTTFVQHILPYISDLNLSNCTIIAPNDIFSKTYSSKFVTDTNSNNQLSTNPTPNYQLSDRKFATMAQLKDLLCQVKMKNVYYKYETNQILKIMNTQEKRYEQQYDQYTQQREQQCEQQNEQQHRRKININHVLVMDDCIYSKGQLITDANLQQLFLNGKQYQISLIITFQYPTYIPLQMRYNIDYVCLVADDNMLSVRKIYETYGNYFPNFELFRELFIELTKNYGIMIIDNKVGLNATINDTIFWYKVDTKKNNLEDQINNNLENNKIIN